MIDDFSLTLGTSPNFEVINPNGVELHNEFQWPQAVTTRLRNITKTGHVLSIVKRI